MAPELLGLGPDAADELDLLGLDRPGHAGDIGRHAAIDLALEALDDLRPADVPPLLRGGHLLAGVGPEDLREHGEGIGLAFVIIGGIGALLVRVETAADGFDPELVEHVLVVLFGRESDRLLGVGCHAEQAGGDKKECLFHMVCFKTSPKLAISP